MIMGRLRLLTEGDADRVLAWLPTVRLLRHRKRKEVSLSNVDSSRLSRENGQLTKVLCILTNHQLCFPSPFVEGNGNNDGNALTAMALSILASRDSKTRI